MSSNASGPQLTRRAAIGACLAGGAMTLSACAGGDDFVELEPGTGGTATFEIDDISVGSGGFLQIDKNAVIVTRPAEDEFHAFSGVCTHQGCTVRMRESVIHCPCHNSEFDVTTGDVLAGPAPTALKEFTIEVSGSTATITV
ncbi:MAG: ubiquinol-cytochrome c reductase iron-sulfur subunit [Agrococcus casei]|uniref:QcrA and Rieske domain-containing protein n=1 Tax=Agrococcus casei TaxID=343512 RepID=UPI003F933414